MEKISVPKILYQAGIRWRSFFLPSVLSLLSGLAEGANVATLLPLCRGLVAGNYEFLKSQEAFQKAVHLFQLEKPSNTFIFTTLLLIVFVSAASKCVFEYCSLYLVSRQIRLFSNNLRKLLFARYVTFGKLFFEQSNLGVIHQHLISATHRISYDLKTYQQALTMVCQLAVYIFAMLWISWQLTLAAFLLFPLLHLASSWVIKKIQITSFNFAEAADNLSQKVFNVFSTITLVKSYHAEEGEKKSFNAMSDKVEKLEFSMDKKDSLVMPLQEFVFLGMMLILVGVVAILVRYRTVSDFSSFLVFFYILKRSSNHFKALNSIRTSYALTVGQWRHVKEALRDEGKYFVRGGPIEFSGLTQGIEIRNLTFGYPSRPEVLKNCSFTLEKGKMTALVGETGAGKSTIVGLICRFYEAPKGQILIDGRDINEYSLGSFYAHTAYVPQDAQLMNDSLRTNLLYGLDPASVSPGKLSDVLKRARLEDYVAHLQEGLDTPLKERGRRQSDALESKVGDRGVRLSGGERQRMSLARAMLKDASILILDEATSALDSQTERLIQDSISEATRGRTSLVIAHRLSTIKHADKIVVIHHGQVIESGTLRELLDRKGKFFELWEAQRFA